MAVFQFIHLRDPSWAADCSTSLTATKPLDIYVDRLKFSVCTLNYIQPAKTGEMNPAPTNHIVFLLWPH